ncbi:MAG TPA: acyl-[ACP]--phospholipid O-acyltransferase [Sedimentisphaerales bacterium]|nr:acyl-[ACP]--phospholipid O-acyltransferase [Sedimentisphaerales bacterium]
MNKSKTKLSAGFAWLNVTQFLGALNDNIFKLLMILFLIGFQGAEKASNVTATAGAVFVVPFLLFTALAGKFADRFSKRNIVVWTKVGEVFVMSAGIVAFMLQSVAGLYCVLFLMATQSAFFGPVKYGIVPELVKNEQLSRANAILEAMTFLAIVIGAAMGPTLSQMTGGRFVFMGAVCIAVSCAGLVASMFIPKTAPMGVKSRASIFFVRDIWRTLLDIRKDRDLFLAVIASAYFLLIGGFIYSNLIPYGINHLGLNETQSGYLFLAAAVGIGFGSLVAGRLSGRNVEFGVVPLGAIGLTVSSAMLGFVPGLYITYALVFLMGSSAGLFVVPLYAFIQLRSPVKKRGEILAASGFLGWIGVIAASGFIYLFTSVWGLTAGQVFMVLGLMTVVPTIATIVILPDFLTRFLCILLTRFCYRIKVEGGDNVPTDKGALLVSNHVSWSDALLIAATQQRRIRFIMEKKYYNKWWLGTIARLMRAIPISADDSPKQIIMSLKQARQAIDDGYMVCIFAEGMITRTGVMAEFKRGFERIIKGSDCDIIPVYLGGVWGSIFSYSSGKIMASWPKRFPYPVSVYFGKALAADSHVSQIRQKVIELSCDYFNSLKSPKRTLVHEFVKTARKNWRKHSISDSTGQKLNYGQTLVMTIALADKFDEFIKAGDKVGILLPPSAGGAIVNLAVTLAGAISVNLNYTMDEQSRADVVQQCGIKYIISSHKFLEKTKLSCSSCGKVVFLEDIAAGVNYKARIKAYLKAKFWSIGLLTKGRKYSGDDLLTVIFSSGSSGRPKGVMLSHHNIISNVEAIRMVINARSDDDMCGVLPFFHSFGFNCGLWMPLISGVSVSYHANPLDAPMLAKSVRENKSTILFTPPTFLLNYMRRLGREDFATLRIVAAGAEKLKTHLADEFEKKFGIRPLEGYGATELSPIVALNLPDIESDGVYQMGTKEGTVGHPVPGVAAKVVDVETGNPLDFGQEGLLMVKGPNVMLGYLGMDDKTAEVLHDGWYDTGDIAKIDADGFITITDRISRFSKIGGEMVPHVVIEQTYFDGLKNDEQVIAVTAVPDEKKNEELVVLYLEKAGTVEQLHQIITESKLPNIYKPKFGNYIMIENMPTLGSGKLDIMKLRKIALEAKNKSSGK